MKRMQQLVWALSAMVVLAGCSSGLQVIQKPQPGEKLAIVMFEDCRVDMDCPGSGKKVSDLYGEILGAPVLMFAKDAKDHDLLLTGILTNYNEAVPMGLANNVVGVDLTLSRTKDNSTLITQKKFVTGPNLFSSTKRLSKDLANDLKRAMGK